MKGYLRVSRAPKENRRKGICRPETLGPFATFPLGWTWTVHFIPSGRNLTLMSPNHFSAEDIPRLNFLKLLVRPKALEGFRGQRGLGEGGVSDQLCPGPVGGTGLRVCHTVTVPSFPPIFRLEGVSSQRQTSHKPSTVT